MGEKPFWDCKEGNLQKIETNTEIVGEGSSIHCKKKDEYLGT